MQRLLAAYLHHGQINMCECRIVERVYIRDRGEASGTSWLAMMKLLYGRTDVGL
jgi:hypothetical protein